MQTAELLIYYRKSKRNFQTEIRGKNMSTGDAAYIKKINRSLIIRNIIEAGKISRADLSKAVVLTRATISAQVADLIDEELIVETPVEHNTVGRRPISLSLNHQAGYALGIDLDYGQISFTLSDLLGRTVSYQTIEIDTTDYSTILHILIEQITSYIANCHDSRYGIIGIVIGIHGLVAKDEIIHFVPRLNWHNIDLKTDLKKEINKDIFIENNANLCSFAERVYDHHETDNLLCATFYSGIGLGMMLNDEFFRGHDGFSGEAGHMIIVPGGKPCSCGNHGCWEQYASESRFLEQIANEKKRPNVTYEDIRTWLNEGDQTVCEKFKQFIYYLSVGMNNMINLYNPDVLVLDSELLRMHPQAIEQITENLSSSISHYRELKISSIGKKACGMGGCALAIKQFLDVPIFNLEYEKVPKQAKVNI
jgi:predicted NBD/HSP70 family sugar kinase